ncbi:MAG: gliding motility-associated C-terminal domain-containing protein [Bacteroidales bacterium]|nr:gliding motility-associated C-terminal domain-containing protein [Bacteroidales bacterium]
MSTIKDILDSHEMTPSADCWQKLSGRLDQLMPQASAEGAGSGQSAMEAGRHASRLAGAAKAKLLITMAGLTIGASVIVLTAVALLKTSPDSVPTPISVPATDTSVTETMEEIPYDPELSTATPTTATQSPVEVSEEAPAPERATERTSEQPVVVTPAVQPAPLAPRTVTPQPPKPVTTPSLVPATPIIVTSAQEDPVIQEQTETLQVVEPTQKLEIPNVFTPNGDGYNDLFVIMGLEQCNKRVLIVRDRSGKTVYQSSKYNNNWDGSNCPEGVYFYQLTFGRNQIEETLQGSVTIIRK